MNEIRNIGPKGCKRRINIGSGILVFSAVYLGILLITKGSAIYWVPLLLSTFTGLVYLLQAVEKTCIILAANGVQMNDDMKQEKIQDNEIARKLRNKSTRLLVKAVMLTLLLLVFYFLVPKT